MTWGFWQWVAFVCCIPYCVLLALAITKLPDLIRSKDHL